MSEYKKAWQTFKALDAKSAGGDKEAQREKIKVMQDIQSIERQAAKEGTILSATINGEQVTVQTKDAPTKRSLQEEYCRKFDDESLVKVGNATDGEEVTTLRKYHQKRLLGKK
jgi:CTP-dependent riboflavin kinase